MPLFGGLPIPRTPFASRGHDAPIAIGEEATVTKGETTASSGQSAPAPARATPTARHAQAQMIAYTATNLYTLMAWLYDKPRP